MAWFTEASGLCFDQCEETVDGIVAFMFDDPERLADLEAIRSGERSPGLWNTCNFCALERIRPDFLALYLKDLQKSVRWDNAMNIDIQLIQSYPEKSFARTWTSWLVALVQHDTDEYTNAPQFTHFNDTYGDTPREQIYAHAFAWSIELLELADSKMPITSEIATHIINVAAYRGNIDMVKFGVDHGGDSRRAAYHAAEGGHVHCMRQIAERKLGTKYACYGAAKAGNYECLLAARKLDEEISSLDIFAAYGGNMDCLQYALDNGSRNPTAVDAAIVVGNLDGLKLIASKMRNVMSDETFLLAAKYGQAECMKFCAKRVASTNSTPCETCIVGEPYGHRIGQRMSDTPSIYVPPSPGGNVAAFMVAREMGSAIGRSCEYAARDGHLDALRFILKEGGDPGSAFSFAAANGHLQCLEILARYGTGLGEDVPAGAVPAGAVPAGGTAKVVFFGTACPDAARNGHLECLEFAYELGAKLLYSCEAAAEGGHPDCLLRAYELGGKITRMVVQNARINGDEETVKLAIKLRAESTAPE